MTLNYIFPEYDWTYYKAIKSNILKGKIKCPYEKRYYNIGFIGEGICDVKDESFYVWYRMLQRCYDEKYYSKEMTYEEAIVDNEWHNFQNFAEWYYKNYYYYNGEKLFLDKDILIKGNKIYSPNTCVFVTRDINNLFTKRDNDRGNLPIGVTELKDGRNKPYLAQLNKKNRRIRKSFDNIDEAFKWYKNEKEKYIKEVADNNKEFIPNKLYEAMYKYKVEIDD